MKHNVLDENATSMLLAGQVTSHVLDKMWCLTFLARLTFIPGWKYHVLRFWKIHFLRFGWNAIPNLFGWECHVYGFSWKSTHHVLDENVIPHIFGWKSHVFHLWPEKSRLTFWMKMSCLTFSDENDTSYFFGWKWHVLRFRMKMTRLTFLDEIVSSYVFGWKCLVTFIRFMLWLQKLRHKYVLHEDVASNCFLKYHI